MVHWQPFAAASRRFGVDLLELVQDQDNINGREHTSRSRSGLSSLLLGDTAGSVVQLANRPVFVVPSMRLAVNRQEYRARPAKAQ